MGSRGRSPSRRSGGLAPRAGGVAKAPSHIQPGDLLHGDENGLLRIPAAAFARLPQAVDRVRARERRLMDFIRSPEFSVENLKGRFIE